MQMENHLSVVIKGDGGGIGSLRRDMKKINQKCGKVKRTEKHHFPAALRIKRRALEAPLKVVTNLQQDKFGQIIQSGTAVCFPLVLCRFIGMSAKQTERENQWLEQGVTPMSKTGKEIGGKCKGVTILTANGI